MGILVVTYMLMYSITLDIVEVIYRDSFTYQSVSHFLGLIGLRRPAGCELNA